MAGLFSLAPTPSSQAGAFVLPPLEEDAPGVERLLGTIGRSSLGVNIGPAPLPLSGKLEDGGVPVHEELPPLPDIGGLDLASSQSGIFPSLDIGVGAEPDEDVEPATQAWGSVDDWRRAAHPVAGPSRPKVRQLTFEELTAAAHLGRRRRASTQRMLTRRLRSLPRRVSYRVCLTS